MSAIDAPAMASWPNGDSARPLSLSTGMTTPSDVAESMIATRSGERTKPAACSPSPATSAIPKETTKPSPLTRSRRPRRRSKSTSSPAIRSRNASPIRFMTCTGPSTSAQPSTCGPTTIPSRISSTTAGNRRRGTSPSASGAAKATAATTARFVKLTSTPAQSRGAPSSLRRGLRARLGS